MIKLLIDKGIDINWLNIYGETLLCVALLRCKKKSLSYSLKTVVFW
ncbi:MAG: ankyrin repeat domain-containing protein [Alphaproteobacteria bacterium]|nr:ankyrin repeat domain-containing protein [Alphaproteobacteria bacterium]